MLIASAAACSAAGVKAVADDLAFAPERAVNGERQPNGQPVHAPTGAAGLVALDHEVAVVLLDSKGITRNPSTDARAMARRSAPNTRGERNDGSPGVPRMVTCTGYRGLTFAREVVRHRRTAARLSPGALRAPPHSRATPRGNGQLPPSCRLDSAHVPLSAWTAEGCVVKRRTTAAIAAREADLIRRMFCCRRRTPTGWARGAADGAKRGRKGAPTSR